MQRIIHVITLSVLMTTAAQAQTFDGDDPSHRNFAGIMGGQTTISTNVFPDLKPLTFTARIGRDFNQYLGLELRAGLTGDDEAGGIEIKIPYFASVLTRIGWLPIDDNRFGIYGLAGYTGGNIQGEFIGRTRDEHVGGPSFGVGLDLLASEHSGFHCEYVRYLDKEIRSYDITVSHIGIGYTYRF